MLWLLLILVGLKLVCSSWTPMDALQEHNLRREIGAMSILEDLFQWHTEQGATTVTKDITIISRDPTVVVTSDKRGNLGPASVIVQDPPGKDWIKDRWQAASDMGGTAIPGSHWVMLDFKTQVTIESIVLDWEAAYADNYRIELRNILDDDDAGWTPIFDGSNPNDCQYRSVERSGQSPGVKYTLPLHVVHTIELGEIDPVIKQMQFRYLRVFIVKPAAGWGVSLWQVDVFGSKV